MYKGLENQCFRKNVTYFGLSRGSYLSPLDRFILLCLNGFKDLLNHFRDLKVAHVKEMGCTTSSAKNTLHTSGQPGTPRSKARAGLNPVQDSAEISEDELHQMKENALQRHDTEIDILSQIAEERRALKAVSTVCIARKQSCEDLLESLSLEELSLVHDQKWYRNLQNQFRSERVKTFLVERRKEWVMYNNVEAISEENLSILGTFFVELMKLVGSQHPDLASGVHTILANLNGHDPFAEIYGKQKELMVSLVRKTLKKMKIVMVAPTTYYQLKPENLYEYELPPGLITINEAMVVVEVYRRGGKLVTSSVHKLLRLGYKILSQRKNVCDVTVTEKEKLIVVGDIHGQLADLLHIIDANGMPGNNTKYIFNGDFVDRGDYGVEVMLILMSLLVARPDCVYMNRGNHEDFAICSVYGFQSECCDKYDPITFSLFIEIFQQLPFYCIINEEIFVVHGGLFHSSDITIEDLNSLDRAQFTLDESSTNTDDFDPIPRSNTAEFLKQMARDSLWSDPVDVPGRHVSQRGAGIAFGADVAREFLEKNNLQFIIRSHECIRSGYDEPYLNSLGADDNPLLCTIFSASDYGGSGNSAAYLEFRLKHRLRRIPTGHKFHPADVAKEDEDEEEDKEKEKDKDINDIRVELVEKTEEKEEEEDQEEEEEEEEQSSPVRPMLLRHPSMTSAIESMQQQLQDNGDNKSELKMIPGTSLYFTVHYFYASPLKFDDIQFSTNETVADLTEMAVQTDGHISQSHSLGDLNTHSNTDAAEHKSPPAAAEGEKEKEKEHHDGQQDDDAASSVANVRVETPQSNLIGWGKTLEDLICDRKQYLYDAFTRMDRDGHGHVHLSDWVKVMSDCFNMSISWKKFAYYLIAPKAKEFCIVKREECVDALKFLDTFHDDIARKLLGTDDDELVTGMDELHDFIDTFRQNSSVSLITINAATVTAATASPSPSTSAIAALNGSSSSSSNKNSSNGPSPPLGNNSSNNNSSIPTATANTTSSSSSSSKTAANVTVSVTQIDTQMPREEILLYHGHHIPIEVINALYSNRDYLEAAFLFFDTNKDGLFTINGFKRGLAALKMDLHSIFPGLTAEKLLQIMDIYECGEVDMNVFYEMYRLCCLNRLYKDDASTKPLLRRETTVAAEIHRLSISGSSAVKMVSNAHHPVQNSLSSVEFKRGKELAVDAELASRRDNDNQEVVGLSIDI